jgi:hypothetical protein
VRESHGRLDPSAAGAVGGGGMDLYRQSVDVSLLESIRKGNFISAAL